MNNEQKMVTEFHAAFGHPIQAFPDEEYVDVETQSLRYDLIAEELAELNQAMVDNDVVEVADALADLLYVVYGTAVVYGIDMEPVFAEVHRSNMSKVGPDGEVEYHKNGKVKKPATFSEPNIKAVLACQE